MTFTTQGASVDFDPRNFGCFWDGVHDDTPGWNTMMAAIPLGSSARICLPMGLGYFADDVHIRFPRI